MLVGADASDGTIGGGHLELQAIDAARARMLREREPHAAARHYPLGPGARPMLRRRGDAAFSRSMTPRWRAGRTASRAFTCSSTAPAMSAARSCRRWRRSMLRIDWIDEREDEFARATSTAPSAWPPTSAASASMRSRPRSALAPPRRVLPRADARARPRPAHHRGDPAARRFRLSRPDRLEDQARSASSTASSSAASPPRRSRASPARSASPASTARSRESIAAAVVAQLLMVSSAIAPSSQPALSPV